MVEALSLSLSLPLAKLMLPENTFNLWAMARLVKAVVVVIVVMMVGRGGVADAASWCVAKSDASAQALQTALDYACGAGADCTPIQSSGSCYLPNTLQSHASYAFNSYYQRKAMATDSCNFAGTATVNTTDPSYGTCVYPSSSTTTNTTGGTTTGLAPSPTTTFTNTPTTQSQSPFDSSGVGALTVTTLLPSTVLLVLSLLFRPI